MASTFQLGDEQPSLKPTNLTKAAANSFNNLFGPPASAKVDDDGDDSGDDDGDDDGGDDGDDDGDGSDDHDQLKREATNEHSLIPDKSDN